MLHPPTTPLRRLIDRAIGGSASEAEVTELAKFAFTLASIRLKQLISSGRLHVQSFNIPLDGIAFDCIADLFERDGEGVFAEIADCFSGERELTLLDDEEVLAYFRHAVFLSIEDGIFRIYREHDPIVSRILRNLKLALKKVPLLKSEVVFGQTHLSIDHGYDPLMHLPPYPHDQLEGVLSELLKVGDTSTSVIHALAEALFRQDTYRRSVALIDVAVLLKRIAGRNEIPVSSLGSVHDSLYQEDIHTIVRRAGGAALERLREKYVGRGKISPELFDRYAKAIQNVLIDTYVKNDGSHLSLSDYLTASIEGLSAEGYRTTHRSTFEYMIRVAKRLVQQELRELL